LLIEASSYHYVTPALAWCLKERPDVPSEVRDYLNTIFALNGRRNEALLATLTRIVSALNAIDIEPVLLKGAARLVECTYPIPALRFLGDLDVLIPPERSSDASASLQAIGFRANAADPLPPSHHHLPMLHDRKTGGGVELHTNLVGGKRREVLPTAWFQAGIRPFLFRNLRIRLPDPTRSVGHIIVHDQLDHGNNRIRRIELRQVLDLAMIRAHQENAIDWAELDHRFCQLGLGGILATYLLIAEELLGQPAPRLRCGPRSDAIEDLRRVVEASNWSRLWERLMLSVRRRRRDPGGVLELFNPHKLPGRLIRALKQIPRAW
jgi:hypothetical protein